MGKGVEMGHTLDPGSARLAQQYPAYWKRY